MARERTERNIWRNMIARCHDPRHASYLRYGAKGLGVCDAWRASFATFLADVGFRPSLGHQIDRIDNSRGYEPGNVRWVSPKERQRNRTNNTLLTFNGITATQAEWCERAGLSQGTVTRRLSLGWSHARILTSRPLTREQRMKVTDTQVLEAIRRVDSGESQGSVARSFAVRRSTLAARMTAIRALARPDGTEGEAG